MILTELLSVLRHKTIDGIDILGLAMQDVDMLAKNWKQGLALGVLAGTFGNVEPALKQMLNTGKIPAVRVHLSNGPCERNNQCDITEPTATDFPILCKRAAMVQNLAIAYPKVRFYISPRLEHDVTNAVLIKRWLHMLDRVAPKCVAVLSVYKGRTSPEALIERHGEGARANIISTDGISLHDCDWKTYRRGAKQIAFAWTPECNLRETGQFVPPRQRTKKMTDRDMGQILRALF